MKKETHFGIEKGVLDVADSLRRLRHMGSIDELVAQLILEEHVRRHGPKLVKRKKNN